MELHETSISCKSFPWKISFVAKQWKKIKSHHAKDAWYEAGKQKDYN